MADVSGFSLSVRIMALRKGQMKASQSFDRAMELHQSQWRQRHCASQDHGWQNKRQYPWILPSNSWEQGLWRGINREGRWPLEPYLKDRGVQKHTGVHNLKSSWIVGANLYFPFGHTLEGRALLAAFLKAHVDPAVEICDGLELEWADEGDLRPELVLGESGGSRGSGQTSPDVAFLINDGRGIILTESKFCEHSFYRCSARRTGDTTGRKGNPDPGRCNNASLLAEDHGGLCHQTAWGRKYWANLADVVSLDVLAALPHCPAAHAGYQLFRQQALAEAIARSERFEVVVSAVAYDDRNEVLKKSLSKTGFATIEDWARLFNGRAQFRAFTHQAWVSWVASNAAEEWSDWLAYVGSRYGYGPTPAA